MLKVHRSAGDYVVVLQRCRKEIIIGKPHGHLTMHARKPLAVLRDRHVQFACPKLTKI